MSETRFQLSLEVSAQQRADILHFIEFKGWNANELLVMEEELQGSSASAENECQSGRDEFPMIRHQPNHSECPHCLCSPCITDDSNKQLWWPEQALQPSRLNSSNRKSVYRRFWGMLSNCGAWADPRYIAKKREVRHGDGTWHIREIMPNCVVTKCRQWYPNIEKAQYMGHKWE